MALKKTISYLDESKMSPYLKSTFGRLSAMIDKTEKKFLDYRSFFLGQSTLGNAIEKNRRHEDNSEECAEALWGYCPNESQFLEPISDYFAGDCGFGLNHKLSMEIVDNIDMKIEFEGLQDALRNEGFETVFQSVAQVYQLPATFVVINSTVTAIVKIPVIPNGDVQNFHLFQQQRQIRVCFSHRK